MPSKLIAPLVDLGSNLHVYMFDLTKISIGAHRQLWNVLRKEIELYEHTEFTGAGDSW